MVAAVKDLEEVLPNVTSVRCAGHTPQLCLIGPIEDNVIHRTIAAARVFVNHFRKHKSSGWSKVLAKDDVTS